MALPPGICGPENGVHWLLCYPGSLHSTMGKGWKWILKRALNLCVRGGCRARNGGKDVQYPSEIHWNKFLTDEL